MVATAVPFELGPFVRDADSESSEIFPEAD